MLEEVLIETPTYKFIQVSDVLGDVMSYRLETRVPVRMFARAGNITFANNVQITDNVLTFDIPLNNRINRLLGSLEVRIAP